MDIASVLPALDRPRVLKESSHGIVTFSIPAPWIISVNEFEALDLAKVPGVPAHELPSSYQELR